jgi:hypothetical protein
MGTICCTVLFIACIAYSSHCCLDISLFEKIQDYKEEVLEQQQAEARQVMLDHFVPICFLSLVYTSHMH